MLYNKNLKKLNRHLATVAVAISLIMVNCTGTGNVDLSKATPLAAEVVQTPSTPVPGTPVGNNLSLSNLMPGQVAALSSFGIVDPVGTTLSQDFDGDAIPNNRESLSNYWVGEYPVIDAQVAPPITMKIQILQSLVKTNDEIVSDINAADLESRKNEGSEKFHQNELAQRTVQYEKAITSSRTVSGSTTSGSNSSGGGGVTFMGFGVNANSGSGSTTESTYSVSNASSLRTQVFEDRPFKNNIDKAATSVKADSSQTKARQYRAEKRLKINQTSTVGANAGYIRAALFIENHSINMPVNLSNILCSLLLETPTGTIIPVQSFKLRNADYSPFSINVYGGTQFGPYVIELTGLNTAEIENAIAQGYTPKIYIIDYDMTHVPDSNYRAFLANTYTGNNLKIIEENAKGRTALVKIFAPQLREMFRIAAFDLLPVPVNICDPNAVSPTAMLKAGSTIRSMLERLACSGITVEFQDYVLDFTGVGIEPPVYNKVYYEGIKSINGIATTAPCNRVITGTGVNGNTVSACEIKVSALTDAEIMNLGLWSVFSNGRFYKNAEYKKDAAGNILFFDIAATTPIIKGIESLVWPGDNYDITYLKMSDITAKVKQFGTNPLETNAQLAITTKWKKADVEPNPFYPTTKSQYLGQASIGDLSHKGDQIVISVKLDKTFYLNPNFGTPVSTGTGLLYKDFSYNFTQDLNRLFAPDEAFDFEINLGLGGTQSDWFSISEAGTPGSILGSCGRTWDFLNQTYNICLELPSATDLNSSLLPNTLVNLYLRSALNNAYRESIWPRTFTDVRRFNAQLSAAGIVGDTTIKAGTSIGTLATGVTEAGVNLKIGGKNYAISSVAVDVNGVYTVSITPPLLEAHNVGEEVSVLAGETYQRVNVYVQNGFEADWNLSYPAGYGQVTDGNVNCTVWPYFYRLPGCQGYNTGSAISNWLGAGAYDNNWGDASNFTSFLSNAFDSMAMTSTGKHMNYTLNMQGAPVVQDSLASTTNANNQVNRKIAVSGDRALIVWQSDNSTTGADYDIRGRVISISTGLPVGNDFLISFNNAGIQDYPQVVVSGNKALVVWFSNHNGVDYNIYGRFVDISGAGTPLGTGDILISALTANQQYYPQMAISGDRALVAWMSGSGGLPYVINGRIIDFTTANVVGTTDLRLGINTTNDYHFPYMAISGNMGIVVWHSFQNSTLSDVYGRVVDISTNTVLGANEFLINTVTAVTQENPRVVASNNRALVVWQSNPSGGATQDIKGRMIDLPIGLPVGAEFAVSQFNTNQQMHPQVANAGDKAVVVWESNANGLYYDIRGRFVNMNTGLTMGNELIISSLGGHNSGGQNIAISGKYALVGWNYCNGMCDIRGRILEMTSGSVQGTGDFLISSTTANDQVTPDIAISASNAIVAWGSFENGADWDIRMAAFNLDTLFPFPYGQNHFFTSPLIERNYTVTTRLKY